MLLCWCLGRGLQPPQLHSDPHTLHCLHSCQGSGWTQHTSLQQTPWGEAVVRPLSRAASHAGDTDTPMQVLALSRSQQARAGDLWFASNLACQSWQRCMAWEGEGLACVSVMISWLSWSLCMSSRPYPCNAASRASSRSLSARKAAFSSARSTACCSSLDISLCRPRAFN